ncbi:glycosyltransferase [Bacteroidota bacterium]
MVIVEYIGYSLITIYSLTILLFVIGWLKLKTFYHTSNLNYIPVSIVIACRNEEDNISQLLDSLINQNYPKEKTEIIIVNDHSEDNTRNIITDFIKDYGYIKLLNSHQNKTGKKEALDIGIKQASSDIIVTTDADCIMRKEWLSSLVGYYINHKPKMLVAPVTFKSSINIFKRLQTLEFLSLIGSGAGAIGINRPIMCNGANLLFEKSIYLESNLQNDLASGDDIFLMLQAKSKDKKCIHFIKSKESIVITNAAKNIRSFFHQRIRWTSKSKSYRNFDIIFAAFIVAITNLFIAGSLVYSMINFSNLFLFFSLFITKSVIDLLILIPITNFVNQQNLLWLFLPLQLIYPFYIIIAVILGLLGNFNWKNRKYH